MTNNTKKSPVIIKKYSNRRLYNTEISNYVTLEDLFEMVKQDVDFVVEDAKTKEDLTRNVLTQIIFEQEAKGYSMLPVNFLKKVIRFYGNKVASILPQYLESSMRAFVESHDKMSDMQIQSEDFYPIKFFEDLTKQNMKFFEDNVNAFYSHIINGKNEK